MGSDLDFQNKVIVVTGGGLGIGRATAAAFARRGGQVAVVDRDEQAGRSCCDEIGAAGGVAVLYPADVSSAGAVQEAIAQIRARFGGIDILVNNAGIQRYGTAMDCPEDVWDEVMGVNLRGMFLMSKHILPALIERRGGAIINVGSVQSVGAVANSAAYVAAKHGVLGLTRSIALDFGPHNIRAYCVCPGAIDTPMLRWSAEQSGNPEAVLEACRRLHVVDRLGRPDEVASVILFLASDLASFMTGSPVMVEGGLLTALGGRAFQESGTGSRLGKRDA